MIVHALRAKNDVSFLDAIFDHLEAEKVFAIVRPDAAAHPALANAVFAERPSGPTGNWFTRGLDLSHGDDPAQIVFSSGTEGTPKAIVLSRRNLDSTVVRLNAAMRTTAEIREYVGVPVSYSFGLGRVRAVAAAGGHSYIPERFDPAELRRLLAGGQVNAISVVPSLCRVILRAAELFRPVADRVRWIEIGSQYMAAEEKAAMRRLFPKARIVQHYGLTEASRSTFLDISQATEASLSSVGAVDGPIEIEIGTGGRIRIRGDHVALGRLGEDNVLRPIADADGWLTTEDEGVLIDGHLHYRGRLDDQINLGGIKLSAEALERDIAAAVPGIDGRFAVVAMPDAMRGHIPLVAVEAGADVALGALQPAITKALAARGITAGDAFEVRKVAELPRTGSGKLKRAALRRDIEAKNAPQAATPAAETRTVEDVFRRAFPNHEVTAGTRFEDLGGDSLTHLSVALDLERILGSLPEDWPTRPAGALAAVARAPSMFSSLDMATLLRALSIVLVVVGHFGLYGYGGTGALALFVIAGLSFAQFTLPTVQRTGSVIAIYSLLIRVVVLAWAVSAVNWALTGYGEPRSFLLIGNWLSPNLSGNAWFIDVYVQNLALLSLPLLSARVRTALARRPFAVLFGAAIAAILVMVASEQVHDANHLYRRLPHLLMWIFLCGAAMHVAPDHKARLAVAGLFSAGWIAFSGLDFRYVILAVGALAVFPSLPIPHLLALPIRHVANASLMIYLTHFQFGLIAEKLIGPNPLAETMLAIVGGTVLWVLYRPVDAWVKRGIEWLAEKIGALRQSAPLRT